ncbi:MAG: hypothetical protein ACR2PZ_16095, partial [Pseudomonadales bacterium]
MFSRTVFTVVGAATLLMGLHMTFRNGDSRDVESPTVAEAPGFRQSDGDRGEHHEGIAALREEISYLRAELSALRQPAVIEEIDALKVQVAALQQRVTGESVAEPVTASDNDTAERGNNELDAAEWMSAAHAKQHTVDQKWVLDAAFDAETTDDDWSTEVRQALHQAFGSQELSDASIHSAECRSTLCRV